MHHILGQVPGIESSVETRLHELETQLTLVATRRKARVENGVDDGLKQRLSLLEQKTEAIAHPRWSRSTIPYTKMIALIQLFKAALTDYYIILSNKNKGGDCLLSSPDARPQSACLQGLRRCPRPIPLLYEVAGGLLRFC